MFHAKQFFILYVIRSKLLVEFNNRILYRRLDVDNPSSIFSAENSEL